MKSMCVVTMVLFLSWMSACRTNQVVAGGDAQVVLDGGSGDGASNPDSSPSFHDGGIHDGGFSSDGGFACACDRWGTQTVTLPAMGDPHYLSYRSRSIEVAYDDGDEKFAVLSLKDSGLSLQIIGVDGQPAADPVVLESFDATWRYFGRVVWAKDRFVVFWNRDPDGNRETSQLMAAAVDIHGNVLAGPLALLPDTMAPVGGAAVADDRVFVIYRDQINFDGPRYVVRLDGDLNVLGTTRVDGLSPLQLELPVSALDGKVALFGAAPDTHGLRWALVDAAGHLTGPKDVSPVQAGFAAAASDGQGKTLVCYNMSKQPLFCRFMDQTTGEPVDREFVARYESTMWSWALIHAGCAYQLLVGWQSGLHPANPASSYRTYEIDSVGNVKMTPFARYWVGASKTVFAFRSASQGLAFLLEDGANMSITTARCRPDEEPPSCDDIDPIMQEMACGGVCDLSQYEVDCCVTAGGQGLCGPEDHYQHMCHENIDRLACFEALQDQQQCGGQNGLMWIEPADCALPW